MPSEKLYRAFQDLERKIHILVRDNGRLQDELAQSKNENQILQSKMAQHKAHLDSMHNQKNISKIVDGMTVGEEKAEELKVQIDSYIKEIDRCIAHLAE